VTQPPRPRYDARDDEGRSAVRSFALRRGRVTAGQASALDRLWPRYGVAVDGRPLDVAALFGRRAPLVVEVGSGMGEATVPMAATDPDRDLLAVDVHTPGLGSLLRGVAEAGLSNVRVAEGDAVGVLRDMLGPGSVDEVRVFFPDPWPKSKHAKRRLVGPAFLDLVASRLRPGGVLHVATDWPAYAAGVAALLAGRTDLVGGVVPRPAARPVTRFERQGLAAGRTAVDVVARAVGGV
jgi:tRNA (guanine-N7-)-methyltransferase